EVPDLRPAVHRLLGAVGGGAVVVEEPVTGAVVAVELVGLAVLVQLGLVPVHLGGAGGAVFVAEQPQHRAGQVLGQVDRRHRILVVEVPGGHDDPATPAVHHRVHLGGAARGQVGVAATGAGAEQPDLAGEVGQRLQVRHARPAVVDDLLVGDVALRAHARGDVVGGAVAEPAVQVR